MAGWTIAEAPHVVVATLDGGAVNSLDEGALRGLDLLLDRVVDDEDVRALVLTGAGSTFCVGLDLDLLGRAFGDHDYFLDVVGRFHAVLRRIETLPAPVVAAVNGTTRAGGFELLLACDLVVAAHEARIADHHLAVGMLPGGGASARLPRLVGPQRARELLFSGRFLTGAEAAEVGLVLRSVPGEHLPAAALELAGAVAGNPRHTVARLKALLAEQDGLPVTDACRVELEHFRRYLDEEPLADDGYRAFVEKRAPAWRTG
ncbi:enoyl-CoA hydratase/isomerase family protein [Geodermatophilus sp. SYSU D00814]